MSPILTRVALAVPFLSLVAAPAAAQCALSITPLSIAAPLPFGSLVNRTLLWDPDGPGPAPESLVVAGFFQTAGGVPCNSVARLDLATGTWSAFGQGVAYEVIGAAAAPNGDLVVGGLVGFNQGRVDVWDGATWTTLPTFDGAVWSVAVLPNGDIVAGGDFTLAGGVACQRVARWNGTAWNAMGAGLVSRPRRMQVRPDGTLLAGAPHTGSGLPGDPAMASWNGTAWSGVAADPVVQPALVQDFFVRPNGNILIAGGLIFLSPTPVFAQVAEWSGAAWSPLGGGVNGPALSIAEAPDGSVLAAGFFTQAGGVAVNNLARFDGVAWTAVAGGLGAGPTHQVFDQVATPQGDVFFGGFFGNPPSAPTENLAVVRSSCPGTTSPFGQAGSGSAGQLLLAPANLPWIGGTFFAAAAQFAPNSLAISAIGFSTASVPMSSIFPQAFPGSTLLLVPDRTIDSVILGGATLVQIPIPDLAVLVGFRFYLQTFGIEFSPGGVLTGIVSSNALDLTIGQF
ncbi:MAG: hypothetical protein AB7O97_12600 [Planctomycetota bacterium]